MRLQAGALELFAERGYNRTTAAEIAAWAGVTERTFFRYFPDKREVLFSGQTVVMATLCAAIADTPGGVGPMETLFGAFRAMLPLLEANRGWLAQRDKIIATTPALLEREITKMTAMGDALAGALIARGVGQPRATLAARIGMTTFAQATSSWLDDPAVGLAERLELTLREVESLISRSRVASNSLG